MVHVVQALHAFFPPPWGSFGEASPLPLIFLFYSFVELARADASHAPLFAVRAASFDNLFKARDSADGFADVVGPD